MRTLAAVCLTTVTAVGLPSQTTHLVGPGGFPTIDAAIAAAAPGDIVLVQAGAYGSLAVDKGLVIRGLGAVYVQTLTPLTWHVPAGQVLEVQDIHLTGGVTIGSGQVALTGCQVSGQVFGAPTPALRVQNAGVHLVDCIVTANSGASALPAVEAAQADVTAVGCTFAVSWFGAAPPAVADLQTSRFAASHCTFQSTQAGGLDAPGIRAGTFCQVWLTDSAITTGPDACALAGSGAMFRVERCVLSPTTATSCGVLQGGPTQLGIEAATELQNGAPYTLHFTGQPFQWIAVHASTGLATTPLPTFFEQPLQLDLTSFWFVGLYPTDFDGTASVTWNMPVGLFVDTPLWLEAITIEATFPWQVAPVVGGIVQ